MRNILSTLLLAALFVMMPEAVMAGTGKVKYTANMSGQVSYYGTAKKENYDVAVRLAGRDLKGLTVEKVSVPVPFKEANVSDMKVWVTRSLSLEDKKNLVDGVSADAVIADGNLSATFASPFTIDTDTLYVGYSFNISKLDKPTKKPVTVAFGDSPLGLYIHSSRTYLKWTDKSEEYCSAMEITLGGVETDAAGIDPVGTIQGQKQMPLNVTFVIRNHGANPVNSIDYSYMVGTTKKTGHKDFEVPVPAFYDAAAKMDLTLDAVDQKGDYPFSFTMEKVNGVAQTTKAYDGKLKIYNVLPKRRSVMEEFTGLWCSNCPRGFVALEVLNRLYPDDFIGLSYHNLDTMEVMDQNEYPVSISGFPSADIDRRYGSIDPFYGKMSSGFGIEQLWKQSCQIMAPAAIETEASFDETGKKINAKATMNFAGDMDDADRYKMEFVLVADDLHGEGNGWAQKNSLSTDAKKELIFDEVDPFVQGNEKVTGLHFNDVVMATTRLTTGLVSLPANVTEDKPVSIEGSFDVDALKFVQDARKLRIVALLIDSKDGTIANGAKAPVTGSEHTGITTLGADKQDCPVAYYDIDGRRLTQPRHGLNIVRFASGKSVVKVIK